MTRRGRTPIASSLTMIAGRVFLISAPIVGSRQISHISPLCMEILAIEGGEGGQFGVGLVISQERLGRLGELLSPV